MHMHNLVTYSDKNVWSKEKYHLTLMQMESEGTGELQMLLKTKTFLLYYSLLMALCESS